MKNTLSQTTYGQHLTLEKNYVDISNVKSTIFRHPDTDFIVKFSRQPPHRLDKYTFIRCHPQQMLLENIRSYT